LSALDYLADTSLPPGIRTHIENHLVRLARAKDQLTLSLATERAEGYVEGVESARALTPATVEALYVAVDNAATARQLELEL